MATRKKKAAKNPAKTHASRPAKSQNDVSRDGSGDSVSGQNKDASVSGTEDPTVASPALQGERVASVNPALEDMTSSSSVPAAATEIGRVPTVESTSASRSFGERVKALMQQKGLSQTDLAQKTGMDRSELNRTLNDKRSPRLDEIVWIATTLGVEPLTLFDDEGELSASVKGAIEGMEAGAKRVLQAEAERDEAKEQLRALERMLADERNAWAREQRELVERHQRERKTTMVRVSALEAELQKSQDALALERAQHAVAMEQLHRGADARIKKQQSEANQREAEANQREAELQKQIGELQIRAYLHKGEVALRDARIVSQGQQIKKLQESATKLQQDASSEGGRLATAGVFTGLAGLLLGAALADSGKRRR